MMLLDDQQRALWKELANAYASDKGPASAAVAHAYSAAADTTGPIADKIYASLYGALARGWALDLSSLGKALSAAYSKAAVDIGSPPVISIATPTINAVVKGQVIVIAKAADNHNIVSVDFDVDNATSWDPGQTIDWPFIGWGCAIDTTKLTEGKHVVVARATDDNGNVTISAAVNFTVKNTAGKPFGTTMGLNLPTGPDADLQWSHDHGLGWVRIAIELGWMRTDGNGAPTDWSHFDHIVATAHGLGLKVLATALGAPPVLNGGHGGSNDWHYLPDTDAHISFWAQNYALGLADHGADAVEIWNEPNNPGWFAKGPIGADPVRWAKLCIASFHAIKSEHPDVPVITGGLSPHGDLNRTPDDPINPINFTKAALQVPGFAKGSAFDWYGHHPYMYPGDPITSQHSWNGCMQTIDIWRLVGSPMALTEYGEPTGPVGDAQAMTEAQQPSHQQRYFEAFDSFVAQGMSIPVTILHTLHDYGPSTSVENYFGLLHADGTEKPAAATFKLRAVTPMP